MTAEQALRASALRNAALRETALRETALRDWSQMLIRHCDSSYDDGGEVIALDIDNARALHAVMINAADSLQALLEER